MPFRKVLPNIELYKFDEKARQFDKILNNIPVLVGKEWQMVTNDPIKFTLTPSKKTAILGEEIELTLTAELLDISPRLLFTLEELRNYSIKVILPQDFIQTGGTYLNFATGTLDPANPKNTYTIKGRYLDKPALDDCFKVLRKLNEEVFVLKNTACINVTDVDVVGVAPETIKETRELTTGIDVSKVKFLTELKWYEGLLYKFGDTEYGTYDLLGRDGYKVVLDFYIQGWDEVYNKGGSLTWSFDIDGVAHENLCESNTISHNFFVNKSQVFKCTLKVYNGLNCNAGTLISTKMQTITLRRSNNPTNILSIETNETSLCPGASTTISTNTNCPASSISWQKDGIAYGSNGATTSVSTTGTYKAVCNSPAMISNTITINVSGTPTVPNIKTNRYSITPGEFATLTATNCQGTVVWQGPNNFTDIGDEISVGKQGNYQALCRSNCNGITYYSDLSAIVGISLLPLRLEADKYEKYSNETAQISAYGCNNGYISWKVNGETLPQSDNPLTAYLAGTYSAQCRSFNGTESDWVALYISEKTSTTPRVTASKTHAYPTDNVTLSASGCPSGWYYKWEIPVRASDNSVTYQYPVGTPQTVQGPATYKVQCILNDQNQSAYESVTVNTLNVGDVVINITANKTEANIGEPVIFTVSGNCPNGGGIRWIINGMNYWSYVGETFQGIGPGTYAARCESGPQISQTVYYTVKPPKPGGISIVSDKTRAKDNELVTLRAIGCTNEVNWTLPNGTEVRGSTILFNFGPGTYKAKCVNKFGFTSDPASITIAEKNWNEPTITQTNTSIAINEMVEYVIEGCPNDWVQWGVPKKDGNGNIYYDYSYSFKTHIIREPGVYKVRCSTGDYTNFQDIVVHPAPANGLFIKANRSVAKYDEAVVLTAFGCPNGTVRWEYGNVTTTGTQITVIGPGLRKARCLNDYSNNGDWAMAQTRSDGSITPYLTATVNQACPNQPVTINAFGCPDGWWYGMQWVKPGQLDYWLNNRNAVENYGQGFWDVFDFGGGTVTRNGPNVYYARCISPDGSWRGDFRDKSITVDPAFPTDLRATNNGPAMVGDVSVRLAVTEVPGASYAWTGPVFASGLRSPQITELTAAKSGIYTVTLNKGVGQPWACSATATTEILINACSDLKIRANNFITSVESYELPKTNIANPNQYDPLVLTVINSKGNQVQNIDFRWKNPLGEDIGLLDMVQVRADGLYTVNLSNSTFSCSLGVKIGAVTFQEELDWTFYPLDKSLIPTGILYDRTSQLAELSIFNHGVLSTSNAKHFQQAYSEIYASSYDKSVLLDNELFDNLRYEYGDLKKIPIGLIWTNFNRLDDNVLTDNLFIKKSGQLYDNPNRVRSPYTADRAFVCAALIDKIQKGITQKFIFANKLFLNNTGMTLQNLQINFDDGNPSVNFTVDSEINVTYTTAGVKTLTFNAQFTNGTTQTTYSNLTVEAFSAKAIPDEIVDVNATIAFTPYETEQFSNIKGRGKVGYYYHPTRQASKTLSKVAIILDGFDVGDTRKFVDLYEDKMSYGTEPNKKYVVEELQNDGFDVLLLNFPIYKVGTQSKTVPNVYRDGGGDYVERNAFVLVELIEQVKVKLIASGSNERIIIIGPSMGGLISRYALTYMEKNNLEHRCKLWISFDSPHRGANINIGDQLMFEYLNRGLGFMQAIKDAMAQLDSKAARQMLLHHYTAVLKPLPNANPEIIAGSPNYRERFVQGLDNLGFPQNPCIRNVALNNGSKVGNLQKNEPNNANPTGGSEALTFFTKKKTYLGAIFPGLALAIGGQLSLNMYNSPAYNQRSSVFKSNYKRGLFFSPSIENRFIKGNPLSNSLDIVPGGYYRVNDDIKDSESGIIGVDVKFAEQSFIPLVSSMALYNTNRDWGMNLQSIVLNPSPSDTPFKAIHAAPTLNENHVEITSAGIQFIRDQILYRNQNIPSGCNN